MRRRLLALLLTLVAVSGVAAGWLFRGEDAAPPGRSEARPRVAMPASLTLARGGSIVGFAQDGRRLVWADTLAGDAGDCTQDLRMRQLDTGRTTSVLAADFCVHVDEGAFEGAMALGGKTLLWQQMRGSNTWFTALLVATSLTSGRSRFLASASVAGGLEAYGDDDATEWFPEETPAAPPSIPFAANGPTAVFVNVPDEQLGPANAGPRDVSRIDGYRIPATDGTFALAAHGDSFAAARGKRVDLYRTSTGRRLGRVSVDGSTVDVALTGRRLAVLVKTRGGGTRLDVYRRDGVLEKRLAVRADDVSMSGDWVVYERDGVIHALDVRTEQRRLLGRERERVLGVSIEDGRVVWATSRAIKTVRVG